MIFIFICINFKSNKIWRYNIIKGLKDILIEEQTRLENIISTVEGRLKHAPEGNLRVSKSHNSIQYYCCDEENKLGCYILKKDFDLACKLAQKSYDKKALEIKLVIYNNKS